MSARAKAHGIRWVATSIGVLSLLACLAIGRKAPEQALLSYLFAFLFFTGLSIGSLAVLLVHGLTGGSWGTWLRPPLLAAARALPLQAVLVVPILMGMRWLYPWARVGALEHDALLRAQSWYLNPTFFVCRSVLYFSLWLLLLAAVAGRRHQERDGLPRIAAIGLIVYALSTLLASTDWAMSLMPHWHSSTFGLLVASGWMLAASALAVTCALLQGATEGAPVQQRIDLGNLLLALTLVWGYLAFMQYLTIWVADLPDETAWYLPRTLTSWRTLAWLLSAARFLLPFAVLLSRAAKRRRTWLTATASLLVLGSLIDAFWLVVPGARPAGFELRWTDLLAPIGVGGLWCALFLEPLRRMRWARPELAYG
ncbi:MAG TPA: hypothetical protein VGL28_06010 [Steroidobacteraceae bacterium]|jgi:Ni/Fe-hydrogenase subunit HybB-like protein